MAEGGGLLNRYRLVKAYRGFESLRLRHLTARPALDESEMISLKLALRSVRAGLFACAVAPEGHASDCEAGSRLACLSRQLAA